MAKKIRLHLWMIVAGGLLLLFLPGILHTQQLRERRRELQAEIERLKQQNAQLRKESTLLKEDPLYIERVARRKLGVARPGEVIYRFGDETSPSH